MSEKMKAAFLYRPGDLRIEETEKPTPRPDEVLIRVKSVGVCGSDVHYYKNGRIGPFVVRAPHILGHESSGEVVEVGSDVKNLKVGDRVVFEPGVPCRRCRFCKMGRYNICPNVVFLGTPPVHGAYREYMTAPEDFLFKLPEEMDFHEGAMIEPLAVGVHACNRGEVGPGQTVAILGAGPIGLVTLQAAKAFGATTIIATDILPSRLDLAKELGATDTINAAEEKDVPGKIQEITGGMGADVVIETAGAVPTTQACVEAARPGGVIVWVGLPEETVFPIDVMTAICKEVDIRGIFRYANAHPTSIELVRAGRVNVKRMITHEFSLDELDEAMQLALSRDPSVVKIMINI